MRICSASFKSVDFDKAMIFMRDLASELDAAAQGKHPDPALLPPGSSEWPFARQLNRRAYDALADEYQESYFKNDLLRQAFDDWFAQLPAGGRVLDAGCGHGDPVIARLLDHGFQVTGSDISPAMLKRARRQFPDVSFLECATTNLELESAFDGACSLSSMLYLDPVDFFHSVYQLYRALKPGGLLFLYGYDLHPFWRGLPYDTQIGQWMWSWTSSQQWVAQALEEHGRFKILHTESVMTDKMKERQVEDWKKSNMTQHEELLKRLPADVAAPPQPDLSNPPDNLAYAYIVIAQRQAD